eukprot:CAMPEP_0197035264 /NCGR_PEP_ID=MMETSP1384-20130603/13118_1 /TAXON_ID=29189 /ORGANISM="Ammonia sp." /LENGTH=459 /DNA_ID=CAMNT_0042465309 /DNA_START=39 /DNA_END=1418 /DNA_ORIENTATION=-
MADEDQTIVVDLGTYSTKINICGESTPIEERTLYVEQIEEEKESTQSTLFYGSRGLDKLKEAATSRAPTDKNKTKRPVTIMHNELFANLSLDDEQDDSGKRDMANFLEHTIFNNPRLQTLHGKSSNHPLLITENIGGSHRHRSLLSEVVFERLSSPRLYFEAAGVLALYATGRLNGLMVDMGYSQCSLIPIVEGYCMDAAARKLAFGGRHFDLYFSHLLRKAGITLHTDYQLEIVRDIKEKKTQCRTDSAYEKLQDDEEMNCEKYELPDGTILQIGNARQRAPEVLFGPHLVGAQYKGIQHEILDCINACDLGVRKQLMANITLVGGTSMCKGFGRRLVNELVSCDYNRYNYDLLIAKNSKDVSINLKDTDKPMIGIASAAGGGASSSAASTSTTSLSKPQKKVNKKTGIRVFAPMNRNHCAWIGGSLLCGMDAFDDNDAWIEQAEYKEFGSNVLFRRH